MFGSKKIKISILNTSWDVMVPVAKVDVLPRIDELIYFESEDKYYQVQTVVHTLNKKQGIFVIVEKFNK